MYRVVASRSSVLFTRQRQLWHMPSLSMATKQPNDINWSLLVPAIQWFHQEHGHFAIPMRFQLPLDHTDEELRGLRLGTMVARFVRSLKTQKKTFKVDMKALDAMGFPYYEADWKHFLWQQVDLAALECFKSLYGHTIVPQTFTVPMNASEPWPRATSGLALGRKVNLLRSKRDQLTHYQLHDLKALGFEWNARDARWNDFFLVALRVFRQLYGHTDVPQTFTIPSHDPTWPRHLWDYPLGLTVMSVRSGVYDARVESSRDALEELGFAFDLSESKWTDKVLPALEVFAQIHDHCMVPVEFIVPQNDPTWPSSLWGLRLGMIVNHIRSYKHFAAQVERDRARLEAIQFVWNVGQSKWNDQFLPALSRYHALHHDCDVPSTFVVPRDSNDWPSALWGLKLGHMVRVVRRGGFADHVAESAEELQSLGFSFNIQEHKWSERILPALEAYYQVYGSCRKLHKSFVVPSSALWPEKTWGLRLGNIVNHIRYGGGYVEYVEAHRVRLVQIGFFKSP